MHFSRVPLALSLLLLFGLFTCGDTPAPGDPDAIAISLTDLEQIAEVDERFQSYNIEMAEVIGGDFWICARRISLHTYSSAVGRRY